MSKLEELIQELCPNGVEFKPLNEIGIIFKGMSGVTNKWAETGNCRFIDYKNVYNHVKVDVCDLPFATVKKTENQIELKTGDILFTSASETPNECAISAVIEDKIINGIFLDDHLFGIRLDEENNPTFFNYYFRSSEFRKSINKTVRGVTRFYISMPSFSDIKVPVPPLEIQREIVRILDDFTEKTEELKEKLSAELTARKKQYDYYTEYLMNFGENVKMLTLGEIGSVRMCKRILKAQTNTKGGIPFYKIGTFGKEPDAYIEEELFEEYKSKYSYPKKGDILISCSGTIGRTVIFDGEPAYFQDSNIVWLEHDGTIVNNKYLLYCYKKQPWQISTGGTISRLYNDNILKAKIPVPPLEEQERIVGILERFDKLCNDISAGLPAEIAARQKQYEYYRDKLLTFKEMSE